MKKSFKIKIGYQADEYVAITKEELPKAYYAFITEGKLITNEGYALRGKDIIRIEPNWNEVMGYTRDYRLTGEDYKDIGEERMKYANQLMTSAKEIAQKVVSNGNTQLLSEPLKISEVSEFAKKISLN